jgi:polysaccharide biosynthesis/export protein
MIIRIFPLAVAISLALTGCKSRSMGLGSKRVAAKAQTVGTAMPPPVALRGTSPAYVTTAQRSSPYRLDSGDRLRVTVFGQANLSRSYSVDGSGFISMPLIGGVKARGATTFELERRIASTLRRKYVKDPKVTVEVEANRPFFILGEVTNAGQFPYVAGMTVQTAVAIAGGYTPRAKKRNFQITRQVNGATVMRTVSPNEKVQPGDTITVKERFF